MAMVSSGLVDVTAPTLSRTMDTSQKSVDMLPFTYPEIKKTGDDWYVRFLVLTKGEIEWFWELWTLFDEMEERMR